MNGPNATSGCVPIEDRLPELALGILGGAERAAVLEHLDTCATCRGVAADWAATVDALPTLLAEAEPPAGFESRTLARMRADRERVPRRSLAHRILGVAAIVAVVMVVTLAAVRILDASGSDGSDGTAATEMQKEPMVGRSGHHAGDAFLTSGDERHVFLDVDYGERSGRYRVEAVDAANRVQTLGWVSVDSGHGAWAGELDTPGAADTPTTLRVVGEDGEVFCWAKFEAKAKAS